VVAQKLENPFRFIHWTENHSLYKSFNVYYTARVDDVFGFASGNLFQEWAYQKPHIIELSIKSSKETIVIVNLLKTGNKVVEVG
jgi:hypothetical protein